MKNTRFRKFTDNFLRANLGGSSWTDDRYWKICCGNFALLARIAKETGIKGLAVDPEMYSTRLFTYDPKSGLTPEQAHTAARRRGKEFGRAVFGAFPVFSNHREPLMNKDAEKSVLKHEPIFL